jgi:hypothetical protein
MPDWFWWFIIGYVVGLVFGPLAIVVWNSGRWPKN